MLVWTNTKLYYETCHKDEFNDKNTHLYMLTLNISNIRMNYVSKR